jgi:hypothetical protein
VDCDSEDSGCDGGMPDRALDYVVANGLVTNASYPYTGNDGQSARPMVLCSTTT